MSETYSPREELIEQAAKAIYGATFGAVPASFEPDALEEWKAIASAALAVFEQAHTPTETHAYRGNRSQDTCWVMVDGEMCRKPIEAHTPTDDEREALAEAAYPSRPFYETGANPWPQSFRDAFLEGWDAHARRTMQGEPGIRVNMDAPIPYVGTTDDFMVNVRPQGEPHDVQVQGAARELLIRAALRAAAAAQEIENRG